MNWVDIAIWLIVLACGAVAARHYRRAQIPLQQGMGLSVDERTWSNVASGVVIGGLAMGGIFGVEWALGALRVSGMRFPGLDFAIWVFSLVLGALWEEFLFRGLMLSGLAVMLRRHWLAVVVMAVFFGLAHAGNPGASALSVLGNALGGLMYAAAFLGSGSIWLPTGLHFAWNFFQGPVLGFPVSGLEMGGLVQQVPIGNVLVTGSGYGPEAGLVGMTFRFVAIGLLAGWLEWRRRNANMGS